jgi:hypothetical protein
MDVSTLAVLEHENLIDAYSLGGVQITGARVERRDGVALILTGHPLQLLNQILVDGDRTTPEALAAAIAVARGRGDRFVVSLRSGIDDRYRPVVGELGLAPISEHPWLPGMALHPIPDAASRSGSPELEIRLAGDGEAVTDHVSVLAEGFGIPKEWVTAFVTETFASSPDVAMYVGYANGVPVTSGLGIRTGQAIGVYNIATVPPARRRGYGETMSLRIAQDGAAAGCEVAVLQSSDQGRPVYERLGFRSVVDYVGFADPGSGES